MRMRNEQKNAETPDAQTKGVIEYLHSEQNSFKKYKKNVTISIHLSLTRTIIFNLKKT